MEEEKPISQIILFESSDGDVSLDVTVDARREEVWLNRKQMAVLFDRDVKTIESTFQMLSKKSFTILQFQLSQNLRQFKRKAVGR